MNAVKVMDYRGLQIQIFIDRDPENPIKDFDGLVKFACLHRKYDLGNMPDLTSPEEIAEHIEDTRAIALPLYLMDHSGLSISTTSAPFESCDSMGWDWGKLGYAFIERKDALRKWGNKIVTQKVRDRALKCIRGMVEMYDGYLSGAVYGFEVLDEEGGTVDSCWGFYGDIDYVIQEAKNAIDAHINTQDPKDQSKMTFKEFCEAYVGFQRQSIYENPNNASWKDARHYQCLFINHETDTRFVTYFSQGFGIEDEPKAHDVMQCLISDARTVMDDQNFVDWAEDLGYDTDSRKAEKIYNIIISQTEKLQTFLGGELWDMVLECEEEE